uniref:Uncharacterized protein n=1 Tax=Kalanchoe fedtschenkoi TaxID=63787 RepID=A0A7N0TKN3_KALFE
MSLPLLLLSPLISARRTPADQSANKIGGLGLDDVLTTYKSKPDAVRPLMIANNHIQRQEEEGRGLGTSQLRGSDVLLALQQAETRRKKNKSSSSSGGAAAGSKSKSKKGATWFGGSDDDVEENDHVRSSLMIKSDWLKRIEDLEKRLQELSEI